MKRTVMLLGVVLGLALVVSSSYAVTYPIFSFHRIQGMIVRDVCQDELGCIWLGSDTGLWRWRQNGFKQVRQQALAVPVTALLADGHGTLFVGTKSGLLRLDTRSTELLRAKPMLADLQVHSLFQSGSGELWVGTNRGIHRVVCMASGCHTQPIEDTTSHTIHAMTMDRQGDLWAGCDRSLIRISHGRVERVHEEMTRDGNVVALLSAPDGSLWVGLRNQGGLYRLAQDRLTRFDASNGLPNDEVNVLTADASGDIWVGTEDGAFCWNGSSFLRVDRWTGLDNTDVHSLFEDRERQLWIGTYGGGVRRLSGTHILSYGLTDGLNHPMVNALRYDRRGRLIVGTIAGAQYFDLDRADYKSLRPRFHVDAVYVDRKGGVWLGGPAGFAAAGDARVDEHLGEVRAMGEDGQGRLLLGTAGGLWRRQGDQLVAVRWPMPHPTRVNVMARGQEESLYVGTDSGLLRLDHSGWTHTLVGRSVSAILSQHDGTVWVAAEGTVLRLKDGDVSEDLPLSLRGGRIRDLVQDDTGMIWAATTDGILCRAGTQWLRFSSDEGLPSRDVRSLIVAPQHKLLVGTTEGLATIDLRRLKPLAVRPCLILRRVVAGGHEWPTWRDGMELPYPQRNLTVHAHCMGWRSAVGAQYQFRLHGYDTDWSPPSPIGRRHYTQLAPGPYRLQVRAVNAMGLTSDVRSFSFVVLMPFWQRGWFIAVAMLVSLLATVGVVRLVRIRLRLRRASVVAEKAKREFVARMSHEIRTPLAVVLSGAERLQQAHLSKEAASECVGAIVQNGRHLLHLVNEILSLEKGQSGQMLLNTSVCHLRGLLDEVGGAARAGARDKGLSFELRVASPVPEYVTTDEAKLRQLLINLLDNAVKFTERGSIRLGVICPSSSAEHLIRFTVEDTGIGIPSSRLRAIFEAFNQVEESFTRRHDGTGLGLTISRTIARLMGGTITVESKLRRGSRFIVDLPLAPCEPEAGTEKRTSLHGEPVGDRLRGTRVLLADDSVAILHMVGALLQEAGANVTLASNGEKAVEMIRRQHVDVALIDIHMPGFDGLSVIRQLIREGHRVPYIAITADATDLMKKRCLDAGFDDYLSKPFQHAQVIEAIQSVIKDRGEPVATRMKETDDQDQVSPSGHVHSQSDEPIHSTLANQSPRLAEASAEFACSLESSIERLKQALAEEDLDEVAELAHRLKGAGGINGYMCVSQTCEDLEQALRRRDRSAMLAHVHALEVLRQRMLLAIEIGSGAVLHPVNSKAV